MFLECTSVCNIVVYIVHVLFDLMCYHGYWYMYVLLLSHMYMYTGQGHTSVYGSKIWPRWSIKSINQCWC